MQGQEERGEPGSPGCRPAGWPYHLRNPLIECRRAERSSAGIPKLGSACQTPLTATTHEMHEPDICSEN